MAIKKIKCKDHTGREFASIAAMCIFWTISHELYKSRIKSGWSVEKALTTPKARNNCEKYLKTNCEKYGGMNINYIANIFKSGYGISREDALQKAREHVKWVKSHKFMKVIK